MVWYLYKHQGFFGQLKLLNKQDWLQLTVAANSCTKNCRSVSWLLLVQRTQLAENGNFLKILTKMCIQ